MNKYRIEITITRPATHEAPHNTRDEVFEGYYASSADAAFGAMRTLAPQAPLCDEEHEIRVRTLRTKLGRSTTGCKRVQ